MKERIIKPGPWPIKEFIVTREEAAAAVGTSLAELDIQIAKTSGPVWVKVGRRLCQIDLGHRTLRLPITNSGTAAKNADAPKVKHPKGKSRFARSLESKPPKAGKPE